MEAEIIVDLGNAVIVSTLYILELLLGIDETTKAGVGDERWGRDMAGG